MRRMKHTLMTFHHVEDVFSLILLLLLLQLKKMKLIWLLLSCDDFELMQLKEDVMKYWVSSFFDVKKHELNFVPVMMDEMNAFLFRNIEMERNGWLLLLLLRTTRLGIVEI